MSQPTFAPEALQAMNDDEIAQHLEAWAAAREAVSCKRTRLGKEPLDTALLREAAARLSIRDALENK